MLRVRVVCVRVVCNRRVCAGSQKHEVRVLMFHGKKEDSTLVASTGFGLVLSPGAPVLVHLQAKAGFMSTDCNLNPCTILQEKLARRRS